VWTKVNLSKHNTYAKKAIGYQEREVFLTRCSAWENLRIVLQLLENWPIKNVCPQVQNLGDDKLSSKWDFLPKISITR